MNKEEIISAFAFDTGRKIESLIKEQTNNLENQNKILEAKLMQWYMKDRDPEFAKHFGIKSFRSGGSESEEISCPNCQGLYVVTDIDDKFLCKDCGSKFIG